MRKPEVLRLRGDDDVVRARQTARRWCEELGMSLVALTKAVTAASELARNAVSVPPHEMHHLLAFASLYIGEGATMASEAAVLGTPALYVNPLDLGYMAEQEERYGLVHRFLDKGTTADDLLEAALPLLTEPDARKRTADARERLLEETEDVTEVICEHLLDTAGP